MDKKVILLVDDVESNVKILKKMLIGNYTVKTAINGYTALEMASKEPIPDLILLDVSMPIMDGYEVLNELRDEELTRDIPVIFITGKDTTDDEERGLIAGAVDYITKPVRAAIVKARVNTHLTIKIQQDELRYIALHDKLTGLYNRHYLIQSSYEKFSRAKRHNQKLCVILSDVDHFKKVNDTYGHLEGDKVLQAIGKLLQEQKRVEDFSARYGGEEFVQVLEFCDASQGAIIAEKIRTELEQMEVDAISATMSFGVADLKEKHQSFEALLKDADDALYQAKRQGRNRVVVFTEEEESNE